MQQRLNHETEIALRSIRGVVLRTWFGIFSERFLRAFWPAYTLIFFGFAFVLMGGLDMVPAWAFGVLIAFAVAVLAVLWIGLRRFRLPERATVITKIDATVNGAPIAALIDSQGTGTGDRASVALWRAHRDQMQARVGTAVAVPGDLRLSAFDRIGLRYVAVIAVLVAILFGSTSHLRNVPLVLAGETTVRIAATWEGWVVPPRHTAVPRMYLADVEEGELQVPEGSEITLRLYGEMGALTVDHTLTEAGDVLLSLIHI